MLKKIISLILVAALVFAFASCGKKEPDDITTAPDVTSEVLPETDKKIAILVPSGAQFNEAAMAAKQLVADYPDKIVVKEFDNSASLKENTNDLISVTREIAQDANFGAIIFAKAVRLTNEAMLEAQTNNPELKLVCIEPEASVGNISGKADAVLCIDWVKAAEDIVACAKAQGAEYFLMTSFNRHISGSSVIDKQSLLAATAKSALNTACQKNGIEFIYHNAPDPISSGGTKAAVQDIKDGIARYKDSGKISGENVAVFSTDYSIQKELISIAEVNKYIYIGPSFPTAFNGLGDVWEVTLPSDSSDIAGYKSSLAAAAPDSLRAGIYTYPLETVLLTSALHITLDLLAGKTTSDNLLERVTLRIKDAAANDKLTVKTFGGYNNVFAVYCPAYEALR